MPLISSFMLLYNGTLLTSFKISSVAVYPCRLTGHGDEETDCIVLAEPMQLESMAESRLSSAAAKVSHTGGREITVYTYL